MLSDSDQPPTLRDKLLDVALRHRLESKGDTIKAEWLDRNGLVSIHQMPKYLQLQSLENITPMVDQMLRVIEDHQDSRVPETVMGLMHGDPANRSLRRAINSLNRKHITRIAQLLTKTDAELLNITNFGKGSLQQIDAALARFGTKRRP